MLALHGPDFVRGARTLSLLVLGHLVSSSCGLAGWVLLAAGRSKMVLANNLGSLALNVVLCLALIPRYGMEGAAASATIALIVLHIVQSTQAWLLARAHPLSRGFVRLASLGTLVIGAQLGLDQVLGANAHARGVGLSIAGALVFLALAWWLAPAGERDVLRMMVRLKPKRRA